MVVTDSIRYLSSVEWSLLCQDYVTIWPVIGWQGLKIQNTLFGATSSATCALIDEGVRSCKKLKICQKKLSSFAMWSWVTMARSDTVVPVRPRSWKQGIHMIDNLDLRNDDDDNSTCSGLEKWPIKSFAMENRSFYKPNLWWVKAEIQECFCRQKWNNRKNGLL